MASSDQRGEWGAIAARISACTGTDFGVQRAEPASGGCINEAWVLSGGGQRFFVKRAPLTAAETFEAEFEGLVELAQAGAVRVPQPVCSGADARHAWLVLEYLDLRGGREGRWARLGIGLAAQHRSVATQFGWRRDNTIGATAQPNTWSADWVAFVREHRLRHQLALAQRNGFRRELAERGARLLERLPAFFVSHAPRPSLLHGDLWSGNVGFLGNGEPVIFDPAVYYGDREADIAMTELFGGFSADFYAAYKQAWALDSGYMVRRRLYNLYHQLNHLNLFGAAYLSDCRNAIERLLAETG
jgi:fructosamine-3-kinase